MNHDDRKLKFIWIGRGAMRIFLPAAIVHVLFGVDIMVSFMATFIVEYLYQSAENQIHQLKLSNAIVEDMKAINRILDAQISTLKVVNVLKAKESERPEPPGSDQNPPMSGAGNGLFGAH